MLDSDGHDGVTVVRLRHGGINALDLELVPAVTAAVGVHDVENPPVGALLSRKDLGTLPVISAGMPWAARHAGPAGLREDDRAQPRLLLHIACQADGQVLTGLPTHYLCGAPVRILLGAIGPGDGPDGPGVCPICAALDHPFGRGRAPHCGAGG